MQVQLEGGVGNKVIFAGGTPGAFTRYIEYTPTSDSGTKQNNIMLAK